MTEASAPYLPDRIPAFLREAPPVERLYKARDQMRILRVVAANIVQLLREGGVADRIQLANLLDGCVDEMGRLLEGRP